MENLNQCPCILFLLLPILLGGIYHLHLHLKGGGVCAGMFLTHRWVRHVSLSFGPPRTGIKRQRVIGRPLFNCVILLVFLIFLSPPLSPHLPHSAFLLADAEETLAPPSYAVLFVHFNERGLAFPLHNFDVTLCIICRCNFIT